MRSLRGRLTIGVTAVLAGVLLAAGAIIAGDVDRDERAALDDRLRRTAELSRATALAAVQQELPTADDRLDAVLSATRTSLRLVLGDTTLLATGDRPPLPARRLPLGLSTRTVDGVRYRGYATTLRDASLGGLARLELTTRLTAVERRQASLRRRLALIGALALAIAAAGVFLASELILRPLRRLHAATTRIAGEEDLSQRVPTDDGPGELRALARSFNSMLTRLGRSAADREQALAATRRFAADAGHELRTPLTSVQATLSALARHPDLPADRRTQMAADALESQRRLVTLLDGLQMLARGEAPPDDEDVDLAEIADAALVAAGQRHPRIRWSSEIPDGAVPLRGWTPGLRSLVDNLLENAARHGAGADGGTVRVAVRAGPPVELVVEDDGPGIPQKDRERVFEPFTHGGDGKQPTGSGLGLSIVAQQVRHHRAAIDLESSPLGGALFRVRF